MIHANRLRSTSISRRRVILAAAGASTLVFSPSILTRVANAQSQDPYTYIRTMPTTTTIGQAPGQAAGEIQQVIADDATWDAYMQLPVKEGQDFHFTCEFDSAWIILTAYGKNLALQQQLDLIGIDTSIEPSYDESTSPVTITGGDINEHYSGNYETNFLARARGNAMRKVFDGAGLTSKDVHTREEIQTSLLAGHPVFFKSTVDFLEWVPATWHTPSGATYPVVLGNDHALIVMGFNADDVIIRDPLGPTSTNATRPYQYRVAWDRFVEVFAAQGNDGVAVGPAAPATATPSPVASR
jgi:uncharacterized protein YvpB